MFHLDPPPNFQGLRKELSLDFYERHLPHWRQVGATYFVTFRLADALPIHQQHMLREVRSDWEFENPEPRSREQLEELTKLIGRQLERWLDRGLGSCLFRDSENREILEKAFRFFDFLPGNVNDHRYEIGAGIIMHNMRIYWCDR